MGSRAAKMDCRRAFFPSLRGQATVELLVILLVLFGVLAASVRLFADQRVSADQQEIQNGAQRSGQLVAQAVVIALDSPIGSSFRFFIPPGPASQTIFVRQGFVDVQSGGQLAHIAIPDRNVSTGTLQDGSTVQVTRTLTGVVFS